jgi:hypothetical protein
LSVLHLEWKEGINMFDIASVIFTLILALATMLCFFYILYRMLREKGALHAILGFIFTPYAYIWGWINAGRLQIADIMIFWTLVSIGSVVFPMVMGLAQVPLAMAAGPNLESIFVEPGSGEASFDGAELVNRGPISPGSQVTGEIESLFEVQEWTLSGSAGQTVNIRCDPASGSGTDPRVTVLGPDGSEIASDDDSGGDRSAEITSLTLPSNGTYRIQVDVWFTGPYLLSLY